MTTLPLIRVGISACLLGERVRYDATHRLDADLLAFFAGIFELVPLCPEVAIGLSVPREPIHLVGPPPGRGMSKAPPVRAVGNRTPRLDVTDALTEYGQRMARELTDISGYVFKARSPSCGVDSVNVYSVTNDHIPTHRGAGLYAEALRVGLPQLPIAEDEQFKDFGFRMQFVRRVLSYHDHQETGHVCRR